LGAGGGILSTANDMAKYGAFHLNKGKVGNVQVVSAVSVFLNIFSWFKGNLRDN